LAHDGGSNGQGGDSQGKVLAACGSQQGAVQGREMVSECAALVSVPACASQRGFGDVLLEENDCSNAGALEVIRRGCSGDVHQGG